MSAIIHMHGFYGGIGPINVHGRISARSCGGSTTGRFYLNGRKGKPIINNFLHDPLQVGVSQGILRFCRRYRDRSGLRF